MRTAQKRKRGRILRRFAIAVLLLPLCLPVINEATRRVAVSVLGSYFGGNASIAKVRLSPFSIRVQQLDIRTLNCQHSLFSVHSVSADVSIWGGIRHGVWLDNIRVVNSHCQLEFDSAGGLITSLPVTDDEDSPKPLGTLPFREIAIRDARFTVHQVGRLPLDINQVAVQILAEGTKVSAQAEVPEILGGEFRLRSAINLAEMTGRSEARLSGVDISSESLCQLPLVPAAINSRQWKASTTVEIEQAGTLDDLNGLIATVHIRELTLAMLERADLIRLSGTVTADQGLLTTEVTGKVLGGTLEVDSRVSLLPGGPKGEVSLRCDHICTDALPQGLIPSEIVSCVTTGVDVNATLADGMIVIDGKSLSTVADTMVYGVPVAPTKVEIKIDGALDCRQTQASNRSHGRLDVVVASDGISLDDIAARELQRLPLVSATGDPVSGTEPPPFELPSFVKPSGDVRAVAHLTIPLAAVADTSSYKLYGVLDLNDVSVNDIVVYHGLVVCSVDAGQMSVIVAEAHLHDTIVDSKSAVSLQASSELTAESQLHAKLNVRGLAAATLARLAKIEDRQFDGTVGVHGEVTCPNRSLASPAAWGGRSSVWLDSISVDDEPVASCTASFELASGKLLLTETVGDVVGGRLVATGGLNLSSPHAFRGNVSIDGAKIESIHRIAVGSQQHVTHGRIDTAIEAKGELAKRFWTVEGSVLGSDLQVAGREIDDTQLLFSGGPHVVVVETPQEGFLGGDLHASLRMPDVTRRESTPGVNVQLDNISIPTLAKFANLQQRTDGMLSCGLYADSFRDLATLNADLELRSAAVSFQNAVLKDVESRLKLANGRATLHARAVGFGGDFDAIAHANIVALAQMTPEELQQYAKLPVDGTVTVTDVKFHEIWPVLGQKKELRPLTGRVSATFERGENELAKKSIASGTVTVEDVRWDRVLWSNRLRSSVVLDEYELSLRELKGTFADGRMLGSARASLRPPHNGTFDFTASRVSLAKALVPIDRRGKTAKGLANLQLRGRLGSRPSGRAFFSMDRGIAGPVALARLRVPIDWSLDPAAKSVQWRTANARVELGGGRVITNAEGRYNGKLNLELSTRAQRVDTGRILANGTKLGGGYLDGMVRLSAKRATAVDDFQGTFVATLSDANSLQLPVLSDLTRFMTTLPSTTSFDESKVTGRVGNGLVYLDRVTLAAANAQVLAEGTATMQGRLNIRVMARTNESGPADQLLEIADSPLLMAAPAPVAMVVRANEALKDKVVHLRVGGTAARPIIRLEPGRQLGQEAIKFFMNQAIAFRKKNDELSF